MAGAIENRPFKRKPKTIKAFHIFRPLILNPNMIKILYFLADTINMKALSAKTIRKAIEFVVLLLYI
jgi:hypothetical protein